MSVRVHARVCVYAPFFSTSLLPEKEGPVFLPAKIISELILSDFQRRNKLLVRRDYISFHFLPGCVAWS